MRRLVLLLPAVLAAGCLKAGIVDEYAPDYRHECIVSPRVPHPPEAVQASVMRMVTRLEGYRRGVLDGLPEGTAVEGRLANLANRIVIILRPAVRIAELARSTPGVRDSPAAAAYECVLDRMGTDAAGESDPEDLPGIFFDYREALGAATDRVERVLFEAGQLDAMRGIYSEGVGVGVLR